MLRNGIWSFGREGTGDPDSRGASESVGSVQSSMQARAKGEAGTGVSLFDDLRAVAPGFGLSLGQGQPGWLCGHLRRVTGGEAL